ncbi:MAG: D-alanyl-D-alanine carboxypeptidase family protein, partial [Clostridia bacterium]|nr:D-alanyl-D-alanine carboxypeptidase family protein [Clostridia bacterium]
MKLPELKFVSPKGKREEVFIFLQSSPIYGKIVLCHILNRKEVFDLNRFLSLLLCAAMMFSIGCSRNLPSESEKPAAAPQSAVETAKPAEPPKSEEKVSQPEPSNEAAPASSEPQPEPEAPSKPSSEAATPSSEADPSSSEPPFSLSAKADVTTERDWRLMLVNPDHILPENFTVDLTMTKYGYEVDSRIVDDVTALIEGAAKDNVKLIICYGYRTLEQSQQLFEKQLRKQLSYGLSEQAALAEAKRWVAPPGT